MLFRGFGVRRFFDKDSGDNAGGGSDDGDAVTKMFTEAEVAKRIEQSMIRHRKQLQKANKEKDDQIKTLTEQMQDIQSQLAAKSGTTQEGDDANNPLAGQIKLMEQRQQREMEELRRKLNTETEARQKAEQIAAEQKRDAIIYKALQDAGCNDNKVGFRFVSPDVFWEEDEERWLVKTEDGTAAEINGDNIREILPPHLKTPLTGGRSGAGSQTAAGKLTQKINELEQAKKKLETLQAIRGASDQEVMEMLRQKRKVAQLELEVANARK